MGKLVCLLSTVPSAESHGKSSCMCGPLQHCTWYLVGSQYMPEGLATPGTMYLLQRLGINMCEMEPVEGKAQCQPRTVVTALTSDYLLPSRLEGQVDGHEGSGMR